MEDHSRYSTTELRIKLEGLNHRSSRRGVGLSPAYLVNMACLVELGSGIKQQVHAGSEVRMEYFVRSKRDLGRGEWEED